MLRIGLRDYGFIAIVAFATSCATELLSFPELGTDGAPMHDASVIDFSGDDLSNVDLALGDLNGADFTTPDLFTPDLFVPDLLPGPDMAIPVFNTAPDSNISAGAGPISIATGLMNNDAFIDVVLLNHDAGTVQIFLSDNMGGLTLHSTTLLPVNPNDAGFGNGNNNGVSIAVGLINSDSHLDVVVMDDFGDMYVMLGNGDGTLQSASTIPTGAPNGPYGVAIGDLNKDGKNDVVTGDWFGGNQAIALRGNGDGTFQAPQLFVIGTSPTSSPKGIAIANVGGDSNNDIIAVNEGGANMGVLINTTASVGGVLTFAALKTFPAGTNPGSLAVADFDGDTNLDVAVANAHDNTVSIFYGTGDTALFGTQTVIGVGTTPASIVATDLSGDGRPDIAVCDAASGGDNVQVVIQNAMGGFYPALNLTAQSTPEAITAATLISGQNPALIVGNGASASISVFLNKN